MRVERISPGLESSVIPDRTPRGRVGATPAIRAHGCRRGDDVEGTQDRVRSEHEESLR